MHAGVGVAYQAAWFGLFSILLVQKAGVAVVEERKQGKPENEGYQMVSRSWVTLILKILIHKLVLMNILMNIGCIL